MSDVLCTKTDGLAHVTTAEIDSHVSHLDISSRHVTHDAQETFQDRVHCRTFKHDEDKYENLTFTSGFSGRVTSTEKSISGAPKKTLCGAWAVRHRIHATKMAILWCTFHAPQKYAILWRTCRYAP